MRNIFGFLKKSPEKSEPPAPAPAVEPADDPTTAPAPATEALVAPESAAELIVTPEALIAPPEPTPPPEVQAPPAVAPTAIPAPIPTATPVAARSWRERLKAGLARTRAQFGGKLRVMFSRGKVDDELLEELETLLLTSDVGMEATQHLLADLKMRAKRDRLDTPEGIQRGLSDAMHELLLPLDQPLDITAHRPFIIMIAGVNGAGKTTSIGKLAKHFQAQGLSVLLAAGDTFRAAAREQLQTWGERNNVTVISQQSGDSAAVIFDAISAARARKIDIVLADTAGRLPTQLNLMEEIAKVRRVIQKADPEAPHETLLVLDANFGQNALQQVKAFDKAINVTGLVVTKLDGSAKGGVVAAIARQCPKPIRFIGVGEGIDDLRPFNARDFVDALFE